MNLRLSLALTSNERTLPILQGRIAPQAAEFVPSALDPAEIFWRQLKYAEFDVSEMSLASLAIATSQGTTAWVALPVFTTRVFFHTDIVVRIDRGIAQPADLAGRRVGVPEYQQTRAVWTRGALWHEFGVEPRSIAWFMERTGERSHGASTGFVPPSDIRLTYMSPETDMGKMLLAGELDAAIRGFSDGNLVNRGHFDVTGNSAIRSLFHDTAAEARRYHAATGIFPINHCVVVRRTLVERHPWLVLNLYDAFLAAKADDAVRRLRSLGPHLAVGTIKRSSLESDPMPYGCMANRHVLETLLAYLYEQGLTRRGVALDELFAPQTLAV